MPRDARAYLADIVAACDAIVAAVRGLDLSDQVMEKVDADGNVLGFSVLKVSALKERPLEVTL